MSMSLLAPACLALVLAVAGRAADIGVDFAVAIDRGDLKAVTALLDAGNPADTIIGEGEGASTPLIRAAWVGRTAIARLLLAHGANVNAPSATGNALHNAVTRGWDDLVVVLIEAGADLELADAFGHPPLILAVSEGHRDIAAALLKAGANPQAASSGYTPMMFAARNGDVEMIRMLAKLGGKVNAAAKGPDGGSTPLLEAIDTDQLEAVKVLIELKVDVNGHGRDGETPLRSAREAGHDEIVAALKAAGAKDAAPAPGRKP